MELGPYLTINKNIKNKINALHLSKVVFTVFIFDNDNALEVYFLTKI